MLEHYERAQARHALALVPMQLRGFVSGSEHLSRRLRVRHMELLSRLPPLRAQLKEAAGTEQRVCPSTAVEGPGLSPWFGSEHHPAEVSLNQTVLVKLVSTFFGCKKLLFTPLNQSLLQHLHTRSLEPSNLGGTQYVDCAYAPTAEKAQDILWVKVHNGPVRNGVKQCQI
ncbi:hypothetical protein EYF80_008404 [Liparis tanakae]|uniref:Uncharacterized protein n=1 Tax=Liparis tanakae TaxID=230148 RepID=A0A4Z2IUW0_9TELE|nr:hypothetical protein EYF80_008404 [Liparis tanakae]